jgi:hypothetical protein
MGKLYLTGHNIVFTWFLQAHRMTQPFGSPQGPLSFSAPSVASAGAGADVAGFSASAFFPVEANGFKVLPVFGVVLF